jgi:hypothetical protein
LHILSRALSPSLLSSGRRVAVPNMQLDDVVEPLE